MNRIESYEKEAFTAVTSKKRVASFLPAFLLPHRFERAETF